MRNKTIKNQGKKRLKILLKDKYGNEVRCFTYIPKRGENKMKKKISYYMDGWLKNQLNKFKKELTKEDEDCILVVDGIEKSGAEIFAMQIAKHIDPSFNIKRVCSTNREFKEIVINARKRQAIVWDKSFVDLSSKTIFSRINRLLVHLMMEMGQKNLCVILVTPSFFRLDRYNAMWRTRGLFHIHEIKGRKGYWKFFDYKKKRMLYIKGQKLLKNKRKKTPYAKLYSSVRASESGRFLNECVVGEKKYANKKKGVRKR